MIQFSNISKSFKATTVLKDISFQVETGEIVAIIGSSGCGKTTLLKMINKLITPSAGNILINGKSITDTDTTQLRRNMGYVIQQTGLFIHMTIGQNIGTIPTLQGKSKSEVKKRVCELMEMVSLSPETYYDRYPSQLSGGQQQRVGVARAFATDPEIILMDEPFSALDPITRSQLQTELRELQMKLQKTIVFVTHDIDEAIKIADRICILHAGNIEQFDTPEEILLHPATHYVSRFIGRDRIWRFPQYLTAGHVMNTHYTVCRPETTLDTLSPTGLLDDIYVLAPDGTLLGIVEHSDIQNSTDLTAEKVMQQGFISIDKDRRMSTALDQIDRARTLHIPVVQNKVMVGYVSQKSLAEALFASSTATGGQEI